MAPSYYPSSTATLRIPWRRFVTQVFFSVLFVTISHHVESLNDSRMKSYIRWSIALFGVVLVDLATRAYDRRRNRVKRFHYCLLLALCLVELHSGTTVIGEQLLESGSVFSQTQHAAVHFCVSFFVISEFEFYHAYIEFRDPKPGPDTIMCILVANVEYYHDFTYSRDPYAFGYTTQDELRRVLQHNLRKLCFWYIGQWLLFYPISSLANILLQSLVGPSPNGWWDLFCAFSSLNVLFKAEESLALPALLLHLLMLKVVRQANYVVFWAVVGMLQRWKARAKAHDDLECASKVAGK